MFSKTKNVRRMFMAAGLTAFAASANAFVLGLDPQIMINRAVGSPTITIRYKGVTASLVDLRINGVSVGTRTVSKLTNSGETNFTLNLGDLHDGDNEVDVQLFDGTGKMVAEDKTNISTAPTQQGPVYLSFPKTGATVQGPVEVKLGFDHDLKDCYVSFFVDGSFKSMTNFPPFAYMWDTERETNGWHQLEAWAIDDTSNTHKTGQVRVFVNNPHGETHRFESPDITPAVNVSSIAKTTLIAKPIKKSNALKHLKSKIAGDLTPLPAAYPGVTSDAVLGSPSGLKPMIASTSGIPMGPKAMLPTNTRIAHHTDSTLVARNDHPGMVVSVTPHVDGQAGRVSSFVEEANSLMTISAGSRMPNLSAFYVALDSNIVDFHGVMPRVDDGVPMTPLRFLLEKKGGKVNWDNPTKTVSAKADGNNLQVRIGDNFALVNKSNVELEKASYLDRGRTIVPLTFLEKALNVKIQYDKGSNHVLITSIPK